MHINDFLKMKAFIKPDDITFIANNCKPVCMHRLACFGLLGLWYKKSVLMRHIYARNYKKLIFSIDWWNASKLISVMNKETPNTASIKTCSLLSDKDTCNYPSLLKKNPDKIRGIVF